MLVSRLSRVALYSSCRTNIPSLCTLSRALNLQNAAAAAEPSDRQSSYHSTSSDRGVSRSFASSSLEDETHDDFRPQTKTGPAPSAAEQIKQDIGDNKVFIYMKGDPSAPQCGFSNMACRILDAYGVDYESRNVLADPDVRDAVKQFTEWPTIPQVFVNGEFVGGSDILLSMHQSGDLYTMLETSGAKPIQPRTG